MSRPSTAAQVFGEEARAAPPGVVVERHAPATARAGTKRRSESDRVIPSFYALVTAVRFMVSRTPGLGSSLTPTTVRAGRWAPIFSA